MVSKVKNSNWQAMAVITGYLVLQVFAVTVQASKTKDNEVQIEQRKKFFKAESLLQQTRSKTYKALFNDLQDYPLQPYLTQQFLLDNLSLKREKEIDKFLTQYRGTPLDWRVRKKWLRYLDKRDKADLFLKYYVSNSDAALNCQQLLYQIDKHGASEAVQKKVTTLWTVGKSQPKACDPLFKQWQKAGFRNNELVMQRIALAADGGKHTLIPYLTSLLPKEQQYLGKLWHNVRRNPVYVSKQNHFIHKNRYEADIMAYGLKRLIWRDPNLAIKTFDKTQNKIDYSEVQKEQITNAFAVSLSMKNHKQANKWLAKVKNGSLTSDLVQWLMTSALRQSNWPLVYSIYKDLPNEMQRNVQWQYWYARALIAMGDEEQGVLKLKEVAQKRHYYGFLAASYLNIPTSLQDNPIVILDKERQKVINHSALRRAFEFYKIDRPLKARSEWNYLLTQLTEREKLVASVLANEIRWFDRAIFTLAEVGYLDDVELRFPLGYQKDIKAFSAKEKINPAWAFAIARRESSFMPDVSSSAGAKGLMQVLPSTASMLNRKKVNKDYLFDTQNNIRLGTQYLKKLLDKNKGNQVLATASYNAGPYRVKKWLSTMQQLPADIWIETIPYKETRNYVKSVLAYQEIYQHKPNEVSNLFESLVKMKIGN